MIYVQLLVKENIGTTDDADFEHSTVQARLLRSLEPETYNCMISISVRANTLDNAKAAVSVLHGEFRSLVLGYSGIVWYTGLNKSNCKGTSFDDCFPKNVFNSTLDPTIYNEP